MSRSGTIQIANGKILTYPSRLPVLSRHVRKALLGPVRHGCCQSSITTRPTKATSLPVLSARYTQRGAGGFDRPKYQPETLRRADACVYSNRIYTLSGLGEPRGGVAVHGMQLPSGAVTVMRHDRGLGTQL